VAGVPRSALVVLVPEAEVLVAPLRLRFDPMAARGVPAHVTVLFPFVSPMDGATVDKVGAICGQHASFTAEFAAVDRFPGLVVWLRPEPSEPFSALTAAMVTEFPDCPPYGGSITDPVPHLTVADGVEWATASTLEAELAPGLPIRSQINELVSLLEDEAGHWNVARTWPLGGAVAAP
jgi:2'-5' RNA ligase superfamily